MEKRKKLTRSILAMFVAVALLGTGFQMAGAAKDTPPCG